MKAAILYGPRDVRYEETTKPAVGPGEVLLHVRGCGICGSDLHEYKLFRYMELGAPANGGRILGHEFSGEVAEMGEGVQGLKVGDRVVSIAYGGNAEYVKISAFARPLILPIPPHITFEEAATNEPLATSLHGVNLAAPQDSETIVVLGMGLIGLGVLQCIKSMSKAKVVAVDVAEKRLDMARKLGADVVLNARQTDPYDYMVKTTGGTKLEFLEFPYANGVDTVIDCAGFANESQGEPPLWKALLMVKPNGKVVEIAVLEKPVELELNIVMRKGIHLIGSWGWQPLEFFHSLEMIKSGKINRQPLITHTFPLAQAKEAYELQLKPNEAIKVVLTA